MDGREQRATAENKPVPGWVERLIDAQMIDMTPPTRGWWAWHLNEFLRYGQRKGEKWEEHEGGLRPRFRIKAPVESILPPPERAAVLGAAQEAVNDDAWAEDLRRALRVRHYQYRTEVTYMNWARRFARQFAAVPASQWDPSHVRRFLEDLAIRRQVSAATQNQAA